jgi:serine O-acetyltransferase
MWCRGDRYAILLSMFGLGTLARVAREVRADLTAAQDRDPAARSVGRAEILLTYGGVQALLSHRVAHALYQAGLPVSPRLLAYGSRALTGVEIHPAAEIGAALFIDHGAGVVIGETAKIGSNVTLYQGVTLGGTGFQRGKRHPTVGDDVVVGSGAKLLGPIDVGNCTKIGANSVVIHDVPANSTVVGNPGHPVRVNGQRPEGPDADWAHLPDPVADALRALATRVNELEGLVADLTGKRPDAGEVRPLRRRQGNDPAGG